MSDRLNTTLKQAKKDKTKLFCAFLTYGFPDVKTTEKLILGFEKEGVDILELGFPFSDPLADGPTIQYSSEQALKRPIRVPAVFKTVAALRKRGLKMPLIFFSYLNPILRYGFKKFVKDAKRAGFDGLIIPDLPPEEETDFIKMCQKNHLAQVFLVAPTTGRRRAQMIAQKSQGFIYYVSLRGVTGARSAIGNDVRAALSRLGRVTKKPVLIGFGVSTSKQAKKLSRMSQGVIVGSAIVDQLRKHRGQVSPAIKYVRKMIRSVKRS